MCRFEPATLQYAATVTTCGLGVYKRGALESGSIRHQEHDESHGDLLNRAIVDIHDQSSLRDM